VLKIANVASWIAALLFAALGVGLLVGGVRLALLGGSVYYLIAGAALISVGVLQVLRNRMAPWLYGALTLGTLIWSVLEVGFDFWALLPRISVLAVLGLSFALPSVRRGFAAPGTAAGGAAGALVPIALFGLSLLLLGFAYGRSGFISAPAIASAPAPSSVPVARGNDWPLYGGTARGDRFSPAAQITPQNASKLEIAWTYRTGDKLRPDEPPKTLTFEATPIKVGDALFVCTAHNVLISLDADSGQERWRFDPHADTTAAMHLACRGVSYDPGNASRDFCDGRILMATVDNRLHALDVATGKPCPDFGTNGAVDLTVGMGNNLPGYYYTTSPPVVIGHTAVLGAFHMDNQTTDEPPGVVRAFDTRTGQLLWAWEVLEPTSRQKLNPGESYARDTANAWSVFSADVDNGLVFVPTGGPPPDYFGGLRTPQQDRYNDSIVALDANTGAVRWSFQTSHHDIWDMDVASQPVVVDLATAKGLRAALIAPTKRGEIFVLDRLTGEPIFPVEERPVPQNPAAGERLSPTQPYTVGFPSFSPPHLTEADMWGATMFDQLLCRIEFRSRRYEGHYTPPTVQGSIGYPDIFGVFNWGSVSVDPERQLMIVNPTWLPYLTKLIPRVEADALGIVPFGTHSTVKAGGGLHVAGYVYPQAGTPYGAVSGPFLSPLGFPCHRPPWGAIAAVDLKSHKVLWQRPFGTTRDVAPMGLPFATGVFSLGGSVVTRGGVAFIGAAIDNYLRAFDMTTGQELWKARLPAGGQATPMTYVSERDGRQYVVIASGGHGSMTTKAGDYIVAFALPK
jgi:quinoprotein glucose dehydrogenase